MISCEKVHRLSKDKGAVNPQNNSTFFDVRLFLTHRSYWRGDIAFAKSYANMEYYHRGVSVLRRNFCEYCD